jgi:hypothetical protein
MPRGCQRLPARSKRTAGQYSGKQLVAHYVLGSLCGIGAVPEPFEPVEAGCPKKWETHLDLSALTSEPFDINPSSGQVRGVSIGLSPLVRTATKGRKCPLILAKRRLGGKTWR